MAKKGVTLIEIMIVLAIAGLFLLALYSFTQKSQKIAHYKGIKSDMQIAARILVERFFMDIQSGHEITSGDENNITINIYKDIPQSSDCMVESVLEEVQYSFDASERIVKRFHRGNYKEFENVKNITFKFLTVEAEGKVFKLAETNDIKKAVAVVLKVNFAKIGDDDNPDKEEFNVITTAYLKTKHALMRFGVNGPIKYGYFSSLEDSSF